MERVRREARKQGAGREGGTGEATPRGRSLTARRQRPSGKERFERKFGGKPGPPRRRAARPQGRRATRGVQWRQDGGPKGERGGERRPQIVDHAEAARRAAGALRPGFAVRQACRVERPAEEVDGRRGRRQRIDKWLFFARVVKSRSLAAKLVQAGRVRINREKAGQAAQPVKPGDVLTIKLDRRIVVLRGARRRRAPRPVRGGADALRGYVAAAGADGRRRLPDAIGAAARGRQRPSDQEGTPRDAEISRRGLTGHTDNCRRTPGGRIASANALPREWLIAGLLQSFGKAGYLTGR